MQSSPSALSQNLHRIQPIKQQQPKEARYSTTRLLLSSEYSSSNNNRENSIDNNNNIKPNLKSKRKIVSKRPKKDFGKPRSKQTLESKNYYNSDNNERDVVIIDNNDNVLIGESERKEIQNNRRFNDDINCEHYYVESNGDVPSANTKSGKAIMTCSGCSVMKGIGDPYYISVIQSAQLFFSSPTIQRYCISSSTTSSTSTRKKKDGTEYINNTPRKNPRFIDDDNDNNNKNRDLSSFFQIIVPTPITGWRTQAKLVATSSSLSLSSTSTWGNKGGCSFGLYRRDSHTVVPITNCQVHHPLINQAVRYLEIATLKARIIPYTDDKNIVKKKTRYLNDEKSNGQLLRYVQIQIERTTQKVCLTLVFYSSDLKETQPALARLIKELNIISENDDLFDVKQEDNNIEDNESLDDVNDDNKVIGGEIKRKQSFWHSIWCHCNDSVGNNIFYRMPSASGNTNNNNVVNVNKRWYRMTGLEYLREPITTGNIGWLYYSPMSFRQGNMNGFDTIVKVISNVIPMGSKVCELYAGVGIIGLSALVYHYQQHLDNKMNHQSLQWLRCSDENPSNPKCFYKSIDSLPQEMTGRQKQNNRFNHMNRFSKHNNDRDDSTMTLGEVSELMKGNNRNNNNNKIMSDIDNQYSVEEKTSYMIASATNALKAGQALGANVLIVDPPRKGLDDGVLIELCKPYNPNQPYADDMTSLLVYVPDATGINFCNDIRILVYVSCGFDAFTRDCERLLSSNAGWTITTATGYILFPGSDHIETLAIFQR